MCRTSQLVSNSFTKVSFEEILSAMEFCARDVLFRVGNVVVSRRKGWPMGGPMSAAATAIDLEVPVGRLHIRPHDVGLSAQDACLIHQAE